MTNIEDQVKADLYRVWKKEAIRIVDINQGWTRIKVPLGRGIHKESKETPLTELFAVIEDFGIHIEDLQKLELNKVEIDRLYNNILMYRESIRFLKATKSRMCGY